MNLAKDGWKVALFAVAVIALGVSVFMNWPKQNVSQHDYAFFIDIADGTLYRAPQKGRTYMANERHPDTGDKTLFRVTRSEGEDWSVSTRYIPRDPEELPVGFEDYVDSGSGRVLVELGDPKNLKIR